MEDHEGVIDDDGRGEEDCAVGPLKFGRRFKKNSLRDPAVGGRVMILAITRPLLMSNGQNRRYSTQRE